MEDWSRQGLWGLDLQPCHASLTTLVADHNCITKLDALQACPSLQKVCAVRFGIDYASSIGCSCHSLIVNYLKTVWSTW